MGRYFPEKLCYLIADILTELRYIFTPHLKRVMKKNLKIILTYKYGENFKKEDLNKYLKETYHNFGRYMVEFFTIPKLNYKKVKKNVRIENIELLNEALLKKKGVIALTAHIGNWELAGVVTSILGYKICAIAIPYLTPKITEIYKKIRESKGVEVILTGSNPKDFVKFKKENKIMAILGDRVFTEKGTIIDFMGRKAIFPRGPATLAIKLKTEFIAGFLVRENKNNYRLFFEKINYPEPDWDEEKKIDYLLNQSAKIIERVILQYPTQWLNFQNIWVNKNEEKI
ncbi:MAG: lysophospholipid acyltransferase family protein [Candidatus Omnitrophica bacterium]|nr:lysophospholipid acyltransferase family protein [Candidatus Omnitrophota bacterium]MCM8806556.1 lysophospholipid acyltransferase family protein [Candidatus Omnitrophota bacterium]